MDGSLSVLLGVRLKCLKHTLIRVAYICVWLFFYHWVFRLTIHCGQNHIWNGQILKPGKE